MNQTKLASENILYYNKACISKSIMNISQRRKAILQVVKQKKQK